MRMILLVYCMTQESGVGAYDATTGESLLLSTRELPQEIKGRAVRYYLSRVYQELRESGSS